MSPVALCVALMLGCQDTTPSATHAVVDTVGTTVWTRNTLSDPAGANRFEIRELWRVGGLDTDSLTQFTGPGLATVVGANGTLVVLDKEPHALTILDRSSGQPLSKFGRRGQGPGELMAPGGVGVDRDGFLWVANSYDGRYTVFSGSGEFVRTITRHRVSRNRNIFPVVFEAAGSVLDHSRGYPDVVFIRVDSTGRTLDSLAAPHPELDLFGSGVLRPGSALLDVSWLRPVLVWDIAPDGEGIWLARADSLTVVRVNFQGDTLQRIVTAHREGSFTVRQRELIARANRELRREGEFTPVVVSAIHALDNQWVLVQIAAEDHGPTNLFDVFDEEGRYLGELRTPLPVSPLSEIGSKGDTLYLPTIGEFDVPIVLAGVLRTSQN